MSRVKRVRKAAKVARQLRRDLEQCELLVGNMGRSYVFDTGPCEADVPGIIKGIMSMAKCAEPGLNGGEKEVALKIQPMGTAPKNRLILLSIPPYKFFKAHWRTGRWVASSGKFMSATPDMEAGEGTIYGDVPPPNGWSELPGECTIVEPFNRLVVGKRYEHEGGRCIRIISAEMRPCGGVFFTVEEEGCEPYILKGSDMTGRWTECKE